MVPQQWQPVHNIGIDYNGGSSIHVSGSAGHHHHHHHHYHHRQRQRRWKVSNDILSQSQQLHVWILFILLQLLLVGTTTVSCSTSSITTGSSGSRTCVVNTGSTDPVIATMKDDASFQEHRRRRRRHIFHLSQTTNESNPLLQYNRQRTQRYFKQDDATSTYTDTLKIRAVSLTFYKPLTLLVSSITPTSKVIATTNTNRQHNSWWKAALSGSVAGAVATTLLYPLDAAKTLRQAHIASFAAAATTTTAITSSTIMATTTTTAAGATASFASVPVIPPITSVYDALRHLIRQRTVYVGLSTAILGAIPSSALYFGAYETSKSFIGRTFIHHRNNRHRRRTSITTTTCTTDSELENDVTMWQRCLWHSTSAAIGNFISSAVFVPKEVIKQQMQYSGTGTKNVLRTVQHIITEKGIKNGLYVGYRATVLRNIPSAALRFTFYEELKRYINRGNKANQSSRNNSNNNTWKLYIAGAMAGAMASGIMTPMDLIKTKLSTGTCPVNEVQGCIQYVIEQNGIVALWTGAGSRMISSALFSAIGFGTFEACQSYLNHHQWYPQRYSDDLCKRR